MYSMNLICNFGGFDYDDSSVYVVDTSMCKMGATMAPCQNIVGHMW
jgi:hypothetical protein